LETYARNFVRVALISLILGMSLGLAMAMFPALILYRPLHVHLLLLGFMAMMVFGIGYHIVPRFQGHAVIPRVWATVHFHLAAWGLALMSLGWIFTRQESSGFEKAFLHLGGLMEWLGMWIFLVILWRGLKPVKRAS
jgi:hypothetical protein